MISVQPETKSFSHLAPRDRESDKGRKMEVSSSLEKSSQFHHTPFYCEENDYMMICKKLCANGLADADGSDLFVVFISNGKKQILLWHQKAGKRADGVILWDYDVFAFRLQSLQALILDGCGTTRVT